MDISKAIPLGGASPISTAGLTKAKEAGGLDFGKVLQNSISQIQEMNTNAEASLEKLVAGEVQDIHQVMIAVEKANITFQTMMQLRNKLLEAYKEIMNMRF
jgi:flagellar hook-basal body complex protein FliE